MITLRMRIGCWIPKATNIHSEYVILIAFSTSTRAARTRLSVTLYVVWLCWPEGLTADVGPHHQPVCSAAVLERHL